MRKKLFTIALSAIMVVAMAVPAFAASPIGQGRVVLNGYGTPNANGRLNIVGNGGSYAGQRVNLWEKTYVNDQVWVIESSGNGSNQGFIYQSQLSSTGVRLAVNAYHPNGTAATYNVTLQPVINNVADTNLYFSLGAGNKFTTWLTGGTAAYCNLYIDLSNPASSRSDVFFHNNTKDPNAYWYWINS